MKKIVVLPGGFHPFHAGHLALYKQALAKFKDADVYMAASDNQKERPFPFRVKQLLATEVAGIPKNRFVQVSGSPFQPDVITNNYTSTEDALIFIRSDKDRKTGPLPDQIRKSDGKMGYYISYPLGKDPALEPFADHAYIDYLDVVPFAGGMTSATEIRNAWPKLDELGKIELIKGMYPKEEMTVPKVKKLVQMLDTVLLGSVVTESLVIDPNNKEALLEALEQLDEVNLKKLAATVGLLGTLITPSMAQAYDVSDMRRMGFEDPEIRVMMQMPAQDRADKINTKIDTLPDVQNFHGRNYSYPKVDADTVDRQSPTGNARSGSNARPDPTANVAPGTGDAETLQKNARLLRDVLQADKRVSKYIRSVYYSHKVNKIVIIPKYDDMGYKSNSWINDKLGSTFIDNVAKKLLVPQIVKAVASIGVPSLDMNNIMIVDRNERAPQNESFVDPDSSKQYWNHDDQNVGVGMQIDMPLRDNDKRGRRQGYNESIDKIRGMIEESTDDQKSKTVDLHRRLFELMEEERDNVVKLRGFGREADKKVVDINKVRAEKERDQERENNVYSEKRTQQENYMNQIQEILFTLHEEFAEMEQLGLMPIDMKDAFENTKKLIDFISDYNPDDDDFPFTESLVEKLHLKTVALKEYFGGWRDTSAPRVLRKQEPESSPKDFWNKVDWSEPSAPRVLRKQEPKTNQFDFWNKIDLSETADYIEEK